MKGVLILLFGLLLTVPAWAGQVSIKETDTAVIVEVTGEPGSTPQDNGGWPVISRNPEATRSTPPSLDSLDENARAEALRKQQAQKERIKARKAARQAAANDE